MGTSGKGTKAESDGYRSRRREEVHCIHYGVIVFVALPENPLAFCQGEAAMEERRLHRETPRMRSRESLARLRGAEEVSLTTNVDDLKTSRQTATTPMIPWGIQPGPGRNKGGARISLDHRDISFLIG